MKNIIIKNIDIKLIKTQRDEILRVISNFEMTGEGNTDHLHGLVNLLDHIIDSNIENRIIKPKHKIGDRVNVINHDSLKLNKLIIQSIEYRTIDEISSALGVEFTPDYYYSFHGIALQAKESDLVK